MITPQYLISAALPAAACLCMAAKPYFTKSSSVKENITTPIVEDKVESVENKVESAEDKGEKTAKAMEDFLRDKEVCPKKRKIVEDNKKDITDYDGDVEGFTKGYVSYLEYSIFNYLKDNMHQFIHEKELYYEFPTYSKEEVYTAAIRLARENKYIFYAVGSDPRNNEIFHSDYFIYRVSYQNVKYRQQWIDNCGRMQYGQIDWYQREDGAIVQRTNAHARPIDFINNNYNDKNQPKVYPKVETLEDKEERIKAVAEEEERKAKITAMNTKLNAELEEAREKELEEQLTELLKETILNAELEEAREKELEEQLTELLKETMKKRHNY